MAHKLWKKEYHALLNTLQQQWNAEISTPKLPDRNVPRAVASSYFFYPRLLADMDTRRIVLSLNEVPAGKEVPETGEEDEYLHFTVVGEFPATFIVTHENFLSRLKKFLRIDHEFQTGNRQFDDDYYLIAYSDAAKAKLREPSLQGAIRSLEPFVAIELREKTIELSRGVATASDLQPEPLEQTFKNLIAIAELLS